MSNFEKLDYVVFYDIDGVLTSARAEIAHGVGDIHAWSVFDPVAINLFNWLDDKFDVRFVCISTWCGLYKEDSNSLPHAHCGMLKNAGFRGKHATPWRVESFRENRPQGIEDYRDAHHAYHDRPIRDFLIFDDTPYKWIDDQKGRWIHTSTADGISKKNMLKVHSIVGQWYRKGELP